jgi:hypothetical protein
VRRDRVAEYRDNQGFGAGRIGTEETPNPGTDLWFHLVIEFRIPLRASQNSE